jgi:hypothetical protein
VLRSVPGRARAGLEAAAVALLALTVLLAGRQLLLGEWSSGAGAALAAAALIALWAARWPVPRGPSTAAGVGVAFVVWSGLFIALGSWVDPGGRRYYVLFDDAFISLRYAANAASGLGLVWNPGERVEGYTNLLMTLLMVIPSQLFDRSHAALAVQVFGVATMLGAAALAFHLARRLGVSCAGSAFSAVLACYPLAYWSLLGMETGLYAVLLLAAVHASLEPGSRPDARVPLFLGLALATRPDALVAAVVVLLFRAVQGGARRRQAVAAEAGMLVACALGLTAFRWLYYGSLLPNTYILKMEGLPLAYRLRTGTLTALPVLAWLSPAIALAGLALREGHDRRRVLLAGLCGASLLSHVYVGGDAWPRWRFVCPALPLLFVLSAQGAGLLAAKLARPLLAPCLLAVAVAVANGPFLPEAFLARYPYLVEYVGWYVRIGVTLQRVCTPEATVGVFGAGAVPYYSGLYAIDFYGKADPRVARRAPDLRLPIGHNKTDLAYSIGERRPDYVEGFVWPPEAARFAGEYERAGAMFLRRGSPHVRWDLVRGGS